MRASELKQHGSLGTPIRLLATGPLTRPDQSLLTAGAFPHITNTHRVSQSRAICWNWGGRQIGIVRIARLSTNTNLSVLVGVLDHFDIFTIFYIFPITIYFPITPKNCSNYQFHCCPWVPTLGQCCESTRAVAVWVAWKGSDGIIKYVWHVQTHVTQAQQSSPIQPSITWEAAEKKIFAGFSRSMFLY